MNHLSRRLLFFVFCCLSLANSRAAEWQVGVARADITPSAPMWMSGYASREHEADGKLTDLWAKALVLEDERGQRVALVTLDLVGIDRELAGRVCQTLQEQHGLTRKSVALCCSHTHSGPVVGHNLGSMYFLSEPQQRQVREYTQHLEETIVATVGRAIEALRPARVGWSSGTATFAVNRRNNPEAQAPELRSKGLLRGPVDHDVPVLAVHDLDDTLRAVVCGYACHATTLSLYQWSGDYPAHAQMELEARHAGCTALFWAGCGGDQNPIPRRTVEHAQDYGRQLADAVDRALAGPLETLSPSLQASYTEAPLAFAKLPTRDELVTQTQATDKYVARRATLLLERIDAGRPLGETYPYPVQCWRLGGQLDWVLLGGEVVVDYALRLKRQHRPRPLWVAAYANDVMAYIPSKRVLDEGGYEGGGAMVYYGLPGPWRGDVEETVIAAATRLLGGE